VLNAASDNEDDGIEVTDSNRTLLLNELNSNGDQTIEVNESEANSQEFQMTDYVNLFD
jgi:hypothetical protein